MEVSSGDDPNRYTSTRSRRNYAGNQPLAIASGKKHAVTGHRRYEARCGRRARSRDHAPTTLEFLIAVAPHPNTEVSESLSFLDGNPIQPLEISGVHGNRIHKLDAPVGNLKVDYAATINPTAVPTSMAWVSNHARGSGITLSR